MSQPEDQARAITAAMLAKDSFSRWLGIELEDVAVGSARISMTVRADMLNGFSVGHGGITFSLADSAFAFACNAHGRMTVSIESSMSYPKSVQLGDKLTAVARELSAGGTIANYDVTVTNGAGEVVGLFRGTAYRTKKQHLG